ncbi:putative AT-hook motif nuclear-localized protein 23-like [Sesbania bispinosa]|nr:putative AT-hook motif nuclear-localized protein 23-like [Sesbania bispinosa]
MVVIGPPVMETTLAEDDDRSQGLGLASAAGPGDVVGCRPHGRTPGSKNKPKPSVNIMREHANTLRAHILEVGSHSDVFECVTTYAWRHQEITSIVRDGTYRTGDLDRDFPFSGLPRFNSSLNHMQNEQMLGKERDACHVERNHSQVLVACYPRKMNSVPKVTWKTSNLAVLRLWFPFPS